jgi:hypothetical protein
MPQYQGHLLLPLGTEYFQRLCYIFVACEKPHQRPSITAATGDADYDVFVGRNVRLLLSLDLETYSNP